MFSERVTALKRSVVDVWEEAKIERPITAKHLKRAGFSGCGTEMLFAALSADYNSGSEAVSCSGLQVVDPSAS